MQTANYILLYFAVVTVSSGDVFSSIKWTRSLNTGILEFQIRFSLEDCIISCWKEQHCKSINYYRHSTLCELNRFDTGNGVKTEANALSIYSEKSDWTEEGILAICSRRNSQSSSDCIRNSDSSFCSKPEFVTETEIVLGNLMRIGNKVRYACIISESEQRTTLYPVGQAECRDDGTWSDAWRPCTEPGMNYALNKQAEQSTVYNGLYDGPSPAFYATDGSKINDLSTPIFTCAHTIDTHGWWYVDMARKVVVGKVIVYLRADPAYYWFQGMKITVAKTAAENEANSGYQCAFFQGPITSLADNPVTIQCRVPLVGRFVRVTATTEYILVMCEFEVYTKVTE